MKEMEKRFDAAVVEKEMQEFWETNRVYAFHEESDRPIYSIDTPPPTVSGSLHVGHIFSYTQAEIIARFHRMNGENVYYPFGFDDNGLPSERLVERETGISAASIPRGEFRQTCMAITSRYEEEFVRLWKSMGFSCDWHLQYTTIGEDTQRLSQQSFLDLAARGIAYSKESPVLFCTECRTSIAQAELDSRESESTFYYLPFQTGETTLPVATTRPELLFGVVAVFVHPEDPRYAEFVGSNIKVPLYDFTVPILTDERVSLEKGTGAVMCATYGDSTDVDWVRDHSLPEKRVILPDGRIDGSVPYLSGMTVKEGREEIIRRLRAHGLILRSENLTHMVGVHERCGTSVEILSSRQWYIDVLSKREDLLAAGDKIHWHPQSMKTRYVSWVENLKWDWCISRQRYFGVPFPVWYCASCVRPHFASPENLPVNPLETPYTGVCTCGGTEFLPESAVMDTWATSSLTPMIHAERAASRGIGEGFLPMSMRTQAHEIIRTWAFYTIAKSLFHTGDIPWKETMICGYVLAKPGEKISKSKGNSGFSPSELIRTYSADAIRYWVAGGKLGTDTYFDPEEMREGSARFLTKLWNSSKFALSHLSDYDPSRTPEEILPIDRWILAKTSETVRIARAYLLQYEIGLARKAVDELFWRDLCDSYIEFCKERLYQPEVHGEEERRSAQAAIFHSLLAILELYAIYVPHITEYIYQKGFRESVGVDSIHLLTWEKDSEEDPEILQFGEFFKEAVYAVRKYKSENSLSMKAEIETVVVRAPESLLPLFRQNEKDLLACTHASAVLYLPV